MKKWVVIFGLLFLLYPLHTRAVSIQGSSISGAQKVSVGEKFSLSFNISFSDLHKDMTDTFGVAEVIFELIFDDSVFTITGVSVNDWVTDIQKENGNYYVDSVTKEVISQNKCIDGLLHCSNYSLTIHFEVNNTDKTSSTIRMGEIIVGLLNVDYIEELSNDMVLLEGVSNKSKTITIEKETKTESNPVTEQPKVEASAKSSNNYLKRLQIDNHSIHFLQTKNEYSITISKEENQLVVHAETDDAKAHYQVIGADNLEQNNYQVRIEVTAENGDKNIYTINVDVREDSGVIYERPKEEKKQTQFIWKNSYTIIGCILLGLIIVLLIIIKLKDRKLNKELDKL